MPYVFSTFLSFLFILYLCTYTYLVSVGHVPEYAPHVLLVWECSGIFLAMDVPVLVFLLVYYYDYTKHLDLLV